jgi:hypothetical protein
MDEDEIEAVVYEKFDEEETEFKEKVFAKILDEFRYRNTYHEQYHGGEVELNAIQTWLRLGENAGTWSGYPLGSSYIDARCGTGYGMENVKDYVEYDHQIAIEHPHLRNLRKDQVKARLEEVRANIQNKIDETRIGANQP